MMIFDPNEKRVGSCLPLIAFNTKYAGTGIGGAVDSWHATVKQSNRRRAF
jgi:hypothetical protein